jgi:hypothetical protein
MQRALDDNPRIAAPLNAATADFAFSHPLQTPKTEVQIWIWIAVSGFPDFRLHPLLLPVAAPNITLVAEKVAEIVCRRPYLAERSEATRIFPA